MSNRKQREADVFRHTVVPGISTPLFLKTAPGATCLLRRTEDTDPERQLKLFADDDGIICVHVRPSAESENVAEFVIECSADGRVTHHPLELRASKNETKEMPFPATQRPAPTKRGTVRPALSEEETLRLSQEELRDRGYPPRPDPEAFTAFRSWLNAVSAPMTVVEPRLVTNTGVSHGGTASVTEVQATTPNWSGLEIRGGPFNEVAGRWWVPTSLSGEANITDYSSTWVGIDGDGLNDLVQTGTEADILVANFGPTIGTFTFLTYQAWPQFLPQQQSEQVINNLSCSTRTSSGSSWARARSAVPITAKVNWASSSRGREVGDGHAASSPAAVYVCPGFF